MKDKDREKKVTKLQLQLTSKLMGTTSVFPLEALRFEDSFCSGLESPASARIVYLRNDLGFVDSNIDVTIGDA